GEAFDCPAFARHWSIRRCQGDAVGLSCHRLPRAACLERPHDNQRNARPPRDRRLARGGERGPCPVPAVYPGGPGQPLGDSGHLQHLRQGRAAMSPSDEVTLLIQRLKRGDREAAAWLWEGYVRRLLGLARKKLGTFPRRAADEEDVALSAFNSFCLRA